VPTRLIHVSDLHVGSRDELAIEAPLRDLVDRVRPELVVVTGDLTHRGHPDQHRRAAAFLRDLGVPVLSVPGNHDIPLAIPARLIRPFREFERHWGTTEPVHRSDSVLAIGLNSVRPWRHQSGGLQAETLRRAGALLADSPSGALRVVALHHHLIGAPWRSRKRPVARRSRVLAAFVDAGAELVLAGHIHQSAVSERRDFEVAGGGEQGVAVSVAPGLGQPRPRRRGEARGLHVCEADEGSIRVETHVWSGGDWLLTAERRFPRGSGTLGPPRSAA